MQRMRSDRRIIFVFMLPALILFFGIMAFPLFSTFWMSFFQWGIGGIGDFIGLKNYIKIFTTDSVLRVAVRNTFLITGMSLLIQVPMAIFLAYLLHGNLRGKGFFRTSFFVPNMISSAAIGLLWMFIFYPDFGLFNALLKAMNLGKWIHVWLGDEKTAIWCVIMAACWQYTGYHMIINLSAMEDVPVSMMEAAEIDGANSWVVFWKIILPNIARIIKTDMVLVATGSLRVFDLIFAMTEGGPNHATEVIASHLYTRTFKSLQFGYGSALAVVLMEMCLLVTFVLNTAFKRIENIV